MVRHVYELLVTALIGGWWHALLPEVSILIENRFKFSGKVSNTANHI
jgi:hypothetical protein